MLMLRHPIRVAVFSPEEAGSRRLNRYAHRGARLALRESWYSSFARLEHP